MFILLNIDFNKQTFYMMKKLLFTLFAFALAIQTFNAQEIAWEFTSDDDGWNRAPARCSTEWNSDGYLDVTTEGKADPFFFNTSAITMSTTNVNFLELSIRNGTPNGGGSIFLIRTGSPPVNIPFSMTPNSTEFETIVINLNTVNNFNNNLQIDDVRIDPNNGGATGVISFDYIRFLETFTNVVLATDLSIDGPSTISTNETANFTTTITPNNTTFNTIEYSVDDSSIASINASGLLIPKMAGTVTVTATTTDSSNLSTTKEVTISEGDNIIFDWSFDSDEEGWKRAQTRCTTTWNSQGYLDVTTTGVNDPFFFKDPKVTLSTTNFNFIELSIKNGTADTAGGILLFTSAGNINVPVSMTANSADFETFIIDLSTINKFTNNLAITDIRLDPNAKGDAGVISYDYIRFVGTPTNPILATGITLDGPSTINSNETAKFIPKVTPTNTTFNTVEYAVDDTSIATITDTGILIPKMAGTVNVTATTTDSSNLSASKEVTITQGDNIIFEWTFDSNDEKDEGWNRAQTRATTAWNSQGYLDVTTTGDRDPFFYRDLKVAFSTSNFNFIELSIKNGTEDTLGGILLFTNNGPINIPVTMTANSSDFETIIIDLSTIAKLTNNLAVTDVRLDPNASGASGVISYDYIRFVGTPINPIIATNLTLDGPSTISTVEIAQITATLMPANATFKTLDYVVSDTSIASIDATGLLVPKTAGTVTVTATTVDGSNISATKTINITQADNTIISWEFDANDEGWNDSLLRCTTAWNSAGYLDVNTNGENDPSVRNVNKQSLNASGANFLVVRVKNGTASDNGQVIFFKEGGAARSAVFNMTPNSTEFETIVVDLPGTVANWSFKDVFTDVRLDPNADGSVGVVSFDYVRVLKEDNTASVASEKMLNTTFMYPNPVNQGQDVFVSLEQFTNNDKITLSVNDITGKLIYSKETLGGVSEPISTSNLSSGLYLVRIKNESSFKRFKLIVK